MFGIGLSELVLIAIIAILFLGPDKLPDALVQIAKFIKSTKKTITEAKSAIEEEVRLDELKQEVLSYKDELNEAAEELKNFKNIDFDNFLDDELSYDDEPSSIKPTYADKKKSQDKSQVIERPMQEVTLKRKSKKTAAPQSNQERLEEASINKDHNGAVDKGDNDA